MVDNHLQQQICDAIEAALRTPWVTVEEWCRRTGDSLDGVYSRRQRGTWRDGIECSKPKGGGLWVNLTAAAEWAAKSNPSMRRSAGDGSRGQS
jgi:hypothetical protein